MKICAFPRLALAVSLSLLCFGVSDLEIAGRDDAHAGYEIRFSEARADPVDRRVARRTSRRTARRVSRRHAYYTALPRGCLWRAPYHVCGGIYYQPQVVDGRTVYIIVTP